MTTTATMTKKKNGAGFGECRTTTLCLYVSQLCLFVTLFGYDFSQQITDKQKNLRW